MIEDREHEIILVHPKVPRSRKNDIPRRRENALRRAIIYEKRIWLQRWLGHLLSDEQVPQITLSITFEN